MKWFPAKKPPPRQDELRALLRREQIVMTHASEKGREISIPKLGQKEKGQIERISRFHTPVFSDD